MSTIDHVPADPTDNFLRLAYLRRRDEIRAFVLAEGERVNADVPRVYTTVAGVWPKLETLREELVANITHFDVARFDALPDYSRALYCCHGRYVASSQAAALDPAVVTRGTTLRDHIQRASEPLVAGGIIPASAVSSFKKEPGHRGLMTDLLIGHQAFTDHQGAIAGRTTVTQAELDEVMELLEKLEAGLGKRDASPAEISEAKLERTQAFYLLLDVYDEIRASVRLIRRRQRDAHVFSPSIIAHPLNTGRRPGRGTDEEEEPPTTGDTGVHPVVNTNADTAATAEVTPTTFAPGTFKRSGQ